MYRVIATIRNERWIAAGHVYVSNRLMPLQNQAAPAVGADAECNLSSLAVHCGNCEGTMSCGSHACCTWALNTLLLSWPSLLL
jgi:hypothetical protein